MKPKSSVPRLIRLAFELARRGEVVEARRAWQSAIERGYEVQPKTLRNLERILHMWEDESPEPPSPLY